MGTPIRPVDEARRLETLRRYALLDELPELALDDLTALAARICSAPVALVSLIDEHRLWFKSRVGLATYETPREDSFCAHAVQLPGLFIVPDAANDERFADHPLVTGEPRIRFYAGAPLVTPEGEALGTLCVMDRVPRGLNPEAQEALRVLSRQVMAQLELRRQTRGLAESEERLFKVFGNCPVGLAIHRWSDRTFIDANAAFSTLTGWKREEIVGRTAIELGLVAEAEAARVRSLLRAEHRAQGVEMTIRTRGGEVREVLLGSELVDLRGQPHAVSTFVDITDRKRAEAAQRESEVNLQLALEAAQLGDWSWDIVRGEIFWSARCKALYGLSPDTAMSYERFLQAVHPEDRVRTDTALHEAVERRSEYEVEKRIIWPDGTIRWTTTRGRVFSDATGRPLRMTGVTFDITARKEAEQKLAGEHTLLRTLIDSMPDVIFTKDLHGRLRISNPAHVRFAGAATEAELMGKTVFDLYPAELAEAYHRDDVEVLASNRPIFNREEPCVKRDGTDCWLVTTKVPLRNQAGEMTGLVGISRDVTARKLAEQRILHLNRVYAVLSDINQTIVREKNPQAMLGAACRTAVEKGRFHLAWIGLVDAVDGRLKITAHAGASGDTLELLQTLLAREPGGGACAFTARALQTGAHGVCNDLVGDPRAAAWREAACQGDFRAMASLPLKSGEQVIGTFNLYSGEPGFFDDEELRLLDELAMDLGFALKVGRRETERREAEDRNARQRSALIALTSERGLYGGDRKAAFQALTETAARTLGVARASIWCYNSEHSAIACMDLFEAAAVRHSAGAVLSAAAHPAYFRALAEVAVLAADDAVTDARTCEFAEGYLRPLGIQAMLDAPIYVDGKPTGVLCHEHIGPPRQWTADEKTFAVALASLVALAIENVERREAEGDLRQSEERFRELAETVEDVFWVTDPAKQQMLYLSPAFENIWGRSCQSLYESPQNWFDAIHPDDRGRVLEAATREPGNDDYDEEYRVIRPDGQTRWIRDRAYPVHDSAGQVVRVVGMARDVTKARAGEDRLREQAALLDAAHEAISVRDLENRIVYWNKGAERIFGWTAEEAVGCDAGELLAPADRPFGEAIAALLAKDEWGGEVCQFTKDRRELIIEARWTLVRDQAGRPKSILAIDTDITEKKRFEAQYLRAQRLESIGTLAGGIAHDLNNVLAPIMISIELFKLDETDPERLALLTSIEKSARHGAELVKQVLSFARGVEGEQVVIDPRHIARDVQQIIQDTFPKNISFRLEGGSDLWTVKADATQLHQVLMNLCVNARDAMSEGGQLTLGLENMVIDELYAGSHPGLTPGNHVIIRVKDTGTGVPREIRDRIFDPFFTTKEVGKGTGLGLATVLTIVKGHGGFIELASEPGRGTTFKVYLPASNQVSTVDESAVARGQLERGRGECILLVDDDDGVRELAGRALENFGYRTRRAGNGAEAVALYARHRGDIAVVLTDMAMPVMDGPATVVALKSMNPDLRIICSSGLNSEEGSAKARGAGVRHFLSKPYTAEAMLKTLAAVLAEPATAPSTSPNPP